MDPLIVYIIADNRSGSTLLDYLLSHHPNAYSLGELHHLNGYYCKTGVGKRTGWKCSCGLIVQDCPFWKDVLESVAFSDSFETKYNCKEPKWSFLNKVVHKKSIAKLINQQSLKSKKEVADNTWMLYKAAITNTKRQIIIDSSKDPVAAYFLNKYRKGKIRFLLLERDILAVAYSNKNRTRELTTDIKSYLNIKEMSIYKGILASYKIMRRNRLFAEEIQKYSSEKIVKKLDYADLTNNPQKVISDICSFLGIDSYIPPEMTNDYSTTPHILHGSLSRYHKRPIRPDNRWERYYEDKPLARIFGKSLLSISK